MKVANIDAELYKTFSGVTSALLFLNSQMTFDVPSILSKFQPVKTKTTTLNVQMKIYFLKLLSLKLSPKLDSIIAGLTFQLFTKQIEIVILKQILKQMMFTDHSDYSLIAMSGNKKG